LSLSLSRVDSGCKDKIRLSDSRRVETFKSNQSAVKHCFLHKGDKQFNLLDRKDVVKVKVDTALSFWSHEIYRICSRWLAVI